MKKFSFFVALQISIGYSFNYLKTFRLNTQIKSVPIEKEDTLTQILSVVLELKNDMRSMNDSLSHRIDTLTHEMRSINNTLTHEMRSINNTLTHAMRSINATMLTLNESFSLFKLDSGYTVESALRGVLASKYGDKYSHPITYSTSYLLIRRLPTKYLSKSDEMLEFDPYLNYQKNLIRLMVFQHSLSCI
jgi:hypothetical protein